MKTLVILLGNARGGEETWNVMYNRLLKPLNADLALLFGETEKKRASLYLRANYVWEMPEYQNWRTYYEDNCTGGWFDFYSLFKGTGIGGGIDDFSGSGAIIFAFRHYLRKHYLDILLKYDRIILTRSDFYYYGDHPDLPNDRFWVVEGEEYYGITDRHHVFPSSIAEKVLGVVNFIDDPNIGNHIYANLAKGVPIHINPEYILKLYLNTNGVSTENKFKRVMFTVAANDDTTRWQKPGPLLPGSSSLRLKYTTEYIQTINNCLAVK